MHPKREVEVSKFLHVAGMRLNPIVRCVGEEIPGSWHVSRDDIKSIVRRRV